MTEGLTGEQHRAADLIGRNWKLEKVSEEIGKSVRQIERWKTDLPEFASAVKATRDRLLDENPTAKAVAESLLTATKPNGEPDNATRLAAAKLLMTTAAPQAPDPADQQPRTKYYGDAEG